MFVARRTRSWLGCAPPLLAALFSCCSTTGGGDGTSAAGSNGASGTVTGGMMLKGPVVRGSKVVLEFGEVLFEIDPLVAGRITSARLAARELLIGSDVHPTNYGSTFWTSPQSDWSWPPVAEIDSAPFRVLSGESSCTLVGPEVNRSENDAIDGLSVTKKFSADFVKNALVVEYTLKNQGTTVKRVAPWEITRVGPGGLTFFANESAPTGTLLPPETSDAAGCTWFRYRNSVEHHAKLYADGNGWIAHVTLEDLLMVKTFSDLGAGEAAEGEAEIEVYASNPPEQPSARYVEVENQGAVTELAAGAALSWTVRWFLRALPAHLAASPGEDLVAFVRQTVK